MAAPAPSSAHATPLSGVHVVADPMGSAAASKSGELLGGPLARAADSGGGRQVLCMELASACDSADVRVHNTAPDIKPTRRVWPPVISALDLAVAVGDQVLARTLLDAPCGAAPTFTTLEFAVRSGMGLALVRELVERWHVRVDVRTERGFGLLDHVSDHTSDDVLRYLAWCAPVCVLPADRARRSARVDALCESTERKGECWHAVGRRVAAQLVAEKRATADLVLTVGPWRPELTALLRADERTTIRVLLAARARVAGLGGPFASFGQLPVELRVELFRWVLCAGRQAPLAVRAA